MVLVMGVMLVVLVCEVVVLVALQRRPTSEEARLHSKRPAESTPCTRHMDNRANPQPCPTMMPGPSNTVACNVVVVVVLVVVLVVVVWLCWLW